MNRVLVDDALRATLGDLQAQAEFCDQAGRVLGYFVPAKDDLHAVREWIRSRISDEELERRAQEPAERTTEEVLKRLHELDAR